MPTLSTGEPPSAIALRWVERCLGPGSKVKMVRPLSGGSSLVNHALLVESRSGTSHRLVLRRWPAGWQGREPGFSPEREIAALALLASCPIPTPTLVAADPGGAYCDAPALLATRLPGHPPRPAPDDLPEYLIQLAAALLEIHAIGGGPTMPAYVPYHDLTSRRMPTHATRPGYWDKAYGIVGGPAPAAAAHFIHRDYHPDNTLWSYGRLTGVVDWTNASHGPIGVDIAHMRWNLAVRYGVDVADRFRATFEQVHSDYTHDPYWDLRCVIDLIPGDTLGEAETQLLETYLEGCL